MRCLAGMPVMPPVIVGAGGDFAEVVRKAQEKKRKEGGKRTASFSKAEENLGGSSSSMMARGLGMFGPLRAGRRRRRSRRASRWRMCAGSRPPAYPSTRPSKRRPGRPPRAAPAHVRGGKCRLRTASDLRRTPFRQRRAAFHLPSRRSAMRRGRRSISNRRDGSGRGFLGHAAGRELRRPTSIDDELQAAAQDAHADRVPADGTRTRVLESDRAAASAAAPAARRRHSCRARVPPRRAERRAATVRRPRRQQARRTTLRAGRSRVHLTRATAATWAFDMTTLGRRGRQGLVFNLGHADQRKRNTCE